MGKTKETVEDLQAYYVSRLTAEEKQQLASLEGLPSREVSTETSVGYAIGHMFERQSVVDEKRLYEMSLRYGIGSVTPEGVQAEARRQGLLVKKGEATTKGVLAEEAKVIAFARDGRGTCRAMGVGGPPALVPPAIAQTASRAKPGDDPAHGRHTSDIVTPSPEQQAVSPKQSNDLSIDQFARASREAALGTSQDRSGSKTLQPTDPQAVSSHRGTSAPGANPHSASVPGDSSTNSAPPPPLSPEQPSW